MRASCRRLATTLLVACACAACARASAGGSAEPAPAPAPAPPVRSTPRANEADVRFMSGMIGHHAQAVVMAGWAPSHGASDAVQRLAERIVVGQNDEIALMQNWLRDQGEPVPEADPAGWRMTMGGTEHVMLMPGMLTDEQMQELDRARGPGFDRFFLTYMIQHHDGALTMVEELFGSYGAGQDEVVFRFASDVFADQSTEIERMQRMLEAISPGGGAP